MQSLSKIENAISNLTSQYNKEAWGKINHSLITYNNEQMERRFCKTDKERPRGDCRLNWPLLSVRPASPQRTGLFVLGFHSVSGSYKFHVLKFLIKNCNEWDNSIILYCILNTVLYFYSIIRIFLIIKKSKNFKNDHNHPTLPQCIKDYVPSITCCFALYYILKFRGFLHLYLVTARRFRG